MQSACFIDFTGSRIKPVLDSDPGSGTTIRKDVGKDFNHIKRAIPFLNSAFPEYHRRYRNWHKHPERRQGLQAHRSVSKVFPHFFHRLQ